MAKKKHTPGPWMRNPAEKTEIMAPSDVMVICRVPSSLYQREANARLIAAAPDLLSVLQDSVEILDVAIESREELIGEVDEVMRDLRDRVRAAIAKAEGK